MGYFAKGQCVATVEAARGLECGSYPRQLEDGTQSCLGITANGIAVKTGSAAAVEVVLAFPSCDENEPYTDLLEVWGLGVLALVIVWCMRTFVYRLAMPQ